jgi:hypothetical protein
VHLNDGAGLSTIVAQGNIGSNVGGTEAKTYSVTANGTSSYVFNGEGLTNSNNPNFTFKGEVPTLSTTGHPFFINTFKVLELQMHTLLELQIMGCIRKDNFVPICTQALYYNCQFHGSMNGTITITN